MTKKTNCRDGDVAKKRVTRAWRGSRRYIKSIRHG